MQTEPTIFMHDQDLILGTMLFHHGGMKPRSLERSVAAPAPSTTTETAFAGVTPATWTFFRALGLGFRGLGA